MTLPKWQTRRLCLFLVFLIALAVRLAFLHVSPDRRWPHAAFYEGDAPLYADWARALCEGRPFEFDLPIHSPGMAWFLLPFAAMSHPDRFLYAKILTALLGATACLLIARLALDRLSPRVAFLVGLMSAASFPLVIQNAALNNETPYTLLLLIILLISINYLNMPRRRTALLLGLTHGLAALFRADHVLLWVLWTAWLLLPRRHAVPPKPSNASAARPLLLVLSALAFFLTTLPWNLRGFFAIRRFNTVPQQPIDYDSLAVPWADDAREFIDSLPAFAREGNVRRFTHVAAQRHIPLVTRPVVEHWLEREISYMPAPLSPVFFISQQGALSFALANHAEADGGFSTRLLDTVMDLPAPEGHVSQNDFAFANPRHLRLYQHGCRIGLRYLADHPADALRLMGRKLARFADGLAGGFLLSNWPHGPRGTRWPVDQLTPDSPSKWLWNAACIALVMLGAWRCPCRDLRELLLLLILSKLLITLAFYGYARQAVAIQPFTLLLIAVAFDRQILDPLLKRRPAFRETINPIAALLALSIAVSTFLAARQAWSYDIAGRADAAPQWGAGAFLSHQPIHARRLIAPDRGTR